MTVLETQASARACEVIAFVACITPNLSRTPISDYDKSLYDFHDKRCCSFTAGLYEIQITSPVMLDLTPPTIATFQGGIPCMKTCINLCGAQ